MAGRTYVAGQTLSLADLVLAADLKAAFEQVRSMLSTVDAQQSRASVVMAPPSPRVHCLLSTSTARWW